MNSKQKQITLLVFLIILLITINYPYLDSLLTNFLSDSETVIVERVIDGDTIVIKNKTSVRLLGINSPEKGEIYYSEAKEFLEMILLNKTVELRFGKDKYDKYNRRLAYIFYKHKNVNLEMVDEGYANFYFPSGKDNYYNDFVKAWDHCINNHVNLCEKSNDECATCIELKEFDYIDEIIILENSCEFDCELTGWGIKDEGRKNFVFQNFILESGKDIIIKVGEGVDDEATLFWKGEDYVWTDSGDTLFLRDSEHKLVLWRSY